mgnify:CR=1 FL=1
MPPPVTTRFSPSSTESWLACPVKHALHKAGWPSRRAGKRELAAILGTALAAGVGAWKASEAAGLPPDPDLCASIAEGTATTMLAALEQHGIEVGDYDAAQRERVVHRAGAGVRNIIAHDPLPPQWKILDVERIIPAWGNCRIDLALETPLGIVIVDWKTKLTSDPKWLPKDVERWRLSEQRHHYSCAYADFLGRPVYAFYIVLVVLEPFRTHVLPFVNDPADLRRWERERARTWAAMEADRDGAPPWPAAVHETVYGPCEYVSACFESQRDPALMDRAYVQVTRKETP